MRDGNTLLVVQRWSQQVSTHFPLAMATVLALLLLGAILIPISSDGSSVVYATAFVVCALAFLARGGARSHMGLAIPVAVTSLLLAALFFVPEPPRPRGLLFVGAVAVGASMLRARNL